MLQLKNLYKFKKQIQYIFVFILMLRVPWNRYSYFSDCEWLGELEPNLDLVIWFLHTIMTNDKCILTPLVLLDWWICLKRRGMETSFSRQNQKELSCSSAHTARNVSCREGLCQDTSTSPASFALLIQDLMLLAQDCHPKLKQQRFTMTRSSIPFSLLLTVTQQYPHGMTGWHSALPPLCAKQHITRHKLQDHLDSWQSPAQPHSFPPVATWLASSLLPTRCLTVGSLHCLQHSSHDLIIMGIHHVDLNHHHTRVLLRQHPDSWPGGTETTAPAISSGFLHEFSCLWSGFPPTNINK